MCKFSNRVTYYGEWKDYHGNGEGAVVNVNGELVDEGIFVKGWMKHKCKHLTLKII